MRRGGSKVLFLPEGDRGSRVSEAQPDTEAAPPLSILPSVSPLLPMAWLKTGSDAPLKTITSRDPSPSRRAADIRRTRSMPGPGARPSVGDRKAREWQKTREIFKITVTFWSCYRGLRRQTWARPCGNSCASFEMRPAVQRRSGRSRRLVIPMRTCRWRMRSGAPRLIRQLHCRRPI